MARVDKCWGSDGSAAFKAFSGVLFLTATIGDKYGIGVERLHIGSKAVENAPASYFQHGVGLVSKLGFLVGACFCLL